MNNYSKFFFSFRSLVAIASSTYTLRISANKKKLCMKLEENPHPNFVDFPLSIVNFDFPVSSRLLIHKSRESCRTLIKSTSLNYCGYLTLFIFMHRPL